MSRGCASRTSGARRGTRATRGNSPPLVAGGETVDFLLMSDLGETVNNSIESVSDSQLHSRVAILVAVAATFMALCNVKDGNIVQAMSQDQARQVDAWSYYQAKGIKLNLVESARDQLVLERSIVSGAGASETRALIDKKLAWYDGQMKKYQSEKDEIKATAEGLQQDYDRLNVRDDQFDMAEALISISLALFGITALTRKQPMLWVAGLFAGLGVVLGLAGFLGRNLHPDFLARLLS
jgi:hypothetical protein